MKRYVRFTGPEKPVATSLTKQDATPRLQFAGSATRSSTGVNLSKDLLAASRLLKHASVTKEDGSVQQVPFTIDRGRVTIKSSDVPKGKRSEIQRQLDTVDGIQSVVFKRFARWNRLGTKTEVIDNRPTVKLSLVSPSTRSVRAGRGTSYQFRIVSNRKVGHNFTTGPL